MDTNMISELKEMPNAIKKIETGTDPKKVEGNKKKLYFFLFFTNLSPKNLFLIKKYDKINSE